MDIFDVIRSDFWLLAEDNHPIRPWSTPEAQDSINRTLQIYAEEIVRRIIGNERSQKAINYLKEFQKSCKDKVGVNLVFSLPDWQP